MAAAAGVEEKRRAWGRHCTARFAEWVCSMTVVFMRAHSGSRWHRVERGGVVWSKRKRTKKDFGQLDSRATHDSRSEKLEVAKSQLHPACSRYSISDLAESPRARPKSMLPSGLYLP